MLAFFLFLKLISFFLNLVIKSLCISNRSQWGCSAMYKTLTQGRLATNSLAPSSPRICGAWWARGWPPFHHTPCHKTNGSLHRTLVLMVPSAWNCFPGPFPGHLLLMVHFSAQMLVPQRGSPSPSHLKLPRQSLSHYPMWLLCNTVKWSCWCVHHLSPCSRS